MIRLISNKKFIGVAKKFLLFYYDSNLELKSKVVTTSKLKQLYEKFIVVGVYVNGKLFVVKSLKDVTLTLVEFRYSLIGEIPRRQFSGFCKIKDEIVRTKYIYDALEI